MIKKLIVGVLLLALGAGGVLGGLWYVNEKPETFNISEAINFSKSLTTYSEDLATAQSEVSELSEDLATAQSEVSELSDQLETAQSNLATALIPFNEQVKNELTFINDYYSLFGYIPNETLIINMDIVDLVALNSREKSAVFTTEELNINIDKYMSNEGDDYNSNLGFLFHPETPPYGTNTYAALRNALIHYTAGKFQLNSFPPYFQLDAYAQEQLHLIQSYMSDPSQNENGMYATTFTFYISCNCFNDEISKEINIEINFSFEQTVQQIV